MVLGEDLPPGPVDDEPPDEVPPARRNPSLRAKVLVCCATGHTSAITETLPDAMPTEAVTDPEAFSETVGGDVAVAIISVSKSDTDPEALVRQTIAAAPYARIVALAADGDDLRTTELPHDESFVTPVDRQTFTTQLKHLYIRAYYAVTVERYYTVSISIRNLEVQLDAGATDNDDAAARLDRLQTTQELLQTYLHQFRSFLDPADLAALKNREDRLQDLVAKTKSDDRHGGHGHPQRCPECALDWEIWHGPRLQGGVQKLGAKTWQCTRCGRVVDTAGPDNYRVR